MLQIKVCGSSQVQLCTGCDKDGDEDSVKESDKDDSLYNAIVISHN